MHESVFGAAAADLQPGARNAVEVCLAIQPRRARGPDRRPGECAGGREHRGGARRCRRAVDGLLIEQVAARPMTVAPPEVIDALEHADAGILCVQPQQGELGARMSIVSVVERRGIRYAHMVGVTPLIMRQGMRADYKLVDALSQSLCERMPHASRLRVETPSGTAFSATFDPAFSWVKTAD